MVTLIKMLTCGLLYPWRDYWIRRADTPGQTTLCIGATPKDIDVMFRRADSDNAGNRDLVLVSTTRSWDSNCRHFVCFLL